MKKHILILMSIMTLSYFAQAQGVTTDDNVSSEVIVQDTLISGCVTALNITDNGSSGFGAFYNTNSAFPFQSGLIMTSGDVDHAEGPNTGSQTGDTGTGSDSDLAQMSIASINDATVIEFDFIPASDTIRFNYIFGSDEFPTYANTQFNDVFGFFISGPGITGSYSNNAENIALLPNGQPVTINNIYNSGLDQYYIGPLKPEDGGGGVTDPYDSAEGYKGCSIMLTAEAIVTACDTFHIKLAIADVGDGSLDSGVFIEAGSFTSGVVINLVNHSEVGTESDLYEGCQNYYVVDLSDGVSDDDVFIYVDVHDSSTATEGEDFSDIDTVIHIPPGELSDTLWYDAFNDGTIEGDETIILEFYNACPCGNFANSVLDTIWIYDADLIKGGIQDVETYYCGANPPSSLNLFAEVNIDEPFYLWENGSTEDNINVVPQPGQQTYHLTISDVCGNEVYDSITIRVSDLNVSSVNVESVTCYNDCDGAVSIDATSSYLPLTYSYANSLYFYIPDSVTVTEDNIIENLCPKDYNLKVTDAIGCYYESNFEVPNKPNVMLSTGILADETLYCEMPDDITLTASTNLSNPNILWWDGTNGETVSFEPELGSHIYSVSITDDCENLFVDEIEISVSEISAEITVEPDLDSVCNGSASVVVNGGFEPYVYYWEDPIDAFGQEVDSLCAGDYTIKVTDSFGCSLITEFHVGHGFGIENLKSDIIVPVYPNPTNDVVYFDLKNLEFKYVNFRYYTLDGSLVHKGRFTEKLIKSPVLTKGAYVVEIILDDGRIARQKIVVL